MKRWLCAAFVLGLAVGLFGEPADLWPEPALCALCDSQAYAAPCIMDLTTGEVGELTGTPLPGKFQHLCPAGFQGVWDSDARSCRVYLPLSGDTWPPSRYCRDCRALLARTTAGSSAVLDLSQPETPRVYPIVVDAVYQVQGQTISVEAQEDRFLVAAVPAP